MHIQAPYAAAAFAGVLALGLSSAYASPFSAGASTVSMSGERGSSSSARDEAQGVLGSILNSVLSVRFGNETTAGKAGAAAHDSSGCDQGKETTATGADAEPQKDEKEPVGPEPIYFGF